MLNASQLLLARNISKAMVRFHSHGGIPGENLPFSLKNRYKLTAIFTTFTVLGFGSPFLIVRHQLLKA
ncbi:cytochrome c oxidase subunit 7C, mitochondrial [Musca domestica]|uniref:Cytochrome c oxidase subunit 7C, mitochondrial n=1 Tax=Musca domestica TaxID=7370 RepID=A0A1I8MMK2_MUSDO|nr:cytochrome c oxidase subunit 7C, mitochondrial [Musca domestica]XP_061389765.1 cytochrome c oxidase subunit 7C, mitochondrial-like [Musca vetustissima]XP_061396541.1 cytochrome c oxidase subunit 7C, mitochondrial-like [Musca vetustissima]